MSNTLDRIKLDQYGNPPMGFYRLKAGEQVHEGDYVRIGHTLVKVKDARYDVVTDSPFGVYYRNLKGG